jgi:CDP-diglyceride synthetase
MRYRPAPIILLSAVLDIAAQLGDLIESLIKRGAGVRDSGTILPGHGGMLDRIDATVFAVPAVWAYGAWRLMQLENPRRILHSVSNLTWRVQVAENHR